MTKIKAVLFDMDGVLVDAKDWHYEALNEALALFGVEISRYDHLHTFDGLPTKVKLQMLGEQFFIPEELYSFINELKQKNTMRIINEKCHPTFQHEYALSRLKSEGYRIAVCSNSIRKTIETMMEKTELLPYIDRIISNEEVKRAKPDPEMYQKAIQAFTLRPEECLVVEDNPNGIKAGRDSGAYVLEVANVLDVNYANIHNKILEAEHDQCADSGNG